MSKVFYAVIMALSIWLGISPWVYGCADWLSRGVAIGAALAAVAFSILGTRQPNSKYPAVLIAVLGFALFAWAVPISRLLGVSSGCHEAIIGLAWLCLALLITQLFVFPFGSAYDKSGNALTTISNIHVKGEDIVVKAVLLGTMPTTIYMRPEEVWKLLPLIDASVIWRLPVIFYRGLKRTRQLVKR